MISDLLAAPRALGALGLALLIFGFAPGAFLAAIVRLLPRDDPRRRELQAELYAVPRWDRPFWVCQQFEVALREGLLPNVSWWIGRLWWHRAKIEPGIKTHRLSPDTFWIPDAEVKDEIREGDLVKLVWLVKRRPGERMWVIVTHRDGDRLTGMLDNQPVFAHLEYGETIQFGIDDIIDYSFDESDEQAA